MYRMYAADPQARINLGIRRRLAPLMENDPDRIKLMNSLLLSMPGSPIIYYGDEIGMGDNIYLGDRNGVRTPMQWSPDRNAGFSRADPQRLYLPPIMDPIYGYEAVNVEAQLRDPSSLLNWMRAHARGAQDQPRLRPRQAARSCSPATARSSPTCASYGDEAILCVANLSRAAQPVELDLRRFKGRVPVEMLGRTAVPADRRAALPADAAGARLLLVPPRRPTPPRRAGTRSVPLREDRRCWCCSTAGPASSATAWCPGASAWRRSCAQQLETETLPRYIEAQRWYAAKGDADRARARSRDHAVWDVGGRSWLLPLLDARRSARAVAPTSCRSRWPGKTATRSACARSRPAAIAQVRQQANVGVMGDAFADEAFCRALVRGDRREPRAARPRTAQLRFRPTARVRAARRRGHRRRCRSRAPQAQSSNTVGHARRDACSSRATGACAPGVNPELEIGPLPDRGRALPALRAARRRGRIRRRRRQRSIDARAAAGLCAEPGRRLGATRSATSSASSSELRDTDGDAAARRARRLPRADRRRSGQRTAELHRALADAHRRPGVRPRAAHRSRPAPRPEARCARRPTPRSAAARATVAALPPARADDAQAVLGARKRARWRCIDACRGRRQGGAARRATTATTTSARCCWRSNDFVIIDFEGEPARPLEERRAQALAAARRRRHAALVQLRALERVAPRGAERAMNWCASTPPRATGSTRRARPSSPAYGEALAAGTAAARSTRGLLELFELEKALYELRYELDNRPDWVHVPLQGILALLGARPSLTRRTRIPGERPWKASHPSRAAARVPAPGRCASCRGCCRGAGRRSCGWLLAKVARFAVSARPARDQLPRAHRALGHRRLPAPGRHRAGHRPTSSGCWSTGW